MCVTVRCRARVKDIFHGAVNGWNWSPTMCELWCACSTLVYFLHNPADKSFHSFNPTPITIWIMLQKQLHVVCHIFVSKYTRVCVCTVSSKCAQPGCKHPAGLINESRSHWNKLVIKLLLRHILKPLQRSWWEASRAGRRWSACRSGSRPEPAGLLLISRFVWV